MNKIIFLENDGAESFAWVSEIPHRHRNMFRVLFRDEYENIFYKDVETGRWIEEDLGYTSLAQEVGKQIIRSMSCPVHVPKLLLWHSQKVDNKAFRFGFISHNHGEQKLYEIYNSEKKYLYTLVEIQNDDWHILDNSQSLLENIDKRFIEQVIEVLPLYTESA